MKKKNYIEPSVTMIKWSALPQLLSGSKFNVSGLRDDEIIVNEDEWED